MIKTHQNFDTYLLSNLYILKAHESEIKEIVEENKMNFGGLMDLVSNTAAKDVDSDEEERKGE